MFRTVILGETFRDEDNFIALKGETIVQGENPSRDPSCVKVFFPS
jgi:hypothetical protein